MAGFTGDVVCVTIQRRTGSAIPDMRCGRVAHLAFYLDARKVVRHQIRSLVSPRNFVPLRSVAIQTYEPGARMDIIMYAERIATFGSAVQKSLILGAKCLRRGVVGVRVSTHVMLVAIQAILVRRSADRKRCPEGPVLIPSETVFISDHKALIHVVCGCMADQAIEPFRRNLRRRYDEPRHHVFGCRMVPAPDVALTAAFAAKNDFPAGMGRLRFNQRRPACPRETAGDSARSVYLPDRDSASACIDLPAVVPVRREPPVHALELVVDGVQNIGDRLHFLDRSVRSPDVNRFVATYARFGALITTDTRISEITDVREFLLPLETWCGGDHPDPGFPRDRIRYRRRERQRAPEKAFGTKIRGDCLELCL